MKISVPKETRPDERRVSLVPEVVGRLTKAGHQVIVERDAGAGALIADESYTKAGATIATSPSELWEADLVIKVSPPNKEELAKLNDRSILIGFLEPLSNPELVKGIAQTGATAFAVEAIPRISRAQSMDALSSQANIAGYRSATLAAQLSEHFFPLLMTAAGTIPPAQVLVLGAGVAGLQAIATTRRLGALVTGYDVRESVKEQVESLGAKFLVLEAGRGAEGEGGYARALTTEEQAAQQAELTEKIATFDIIISTAFVPGRPAPRLISADAVEKLKPGSVVIDLAGESGGNCELSVPGETVTTPNGVKIAAPLGLPNTMPQQASKLYARNIEALLAIMVDKENQLQLDFEDEVIAGACIARGGEIVHPMARERAGVA
jgi:NAD(P) transhydrogenase subunit alpha